MNDRQTSLFILSSTWALAFSDSKSLELEDGSGRKRGSRARVLGFSRAFRDYGICFIWNESWMSHTRGYTTTCLYLWRTFFSFRCFRNLLFSTKKNSQFSRIVVLIRFQGRATLSKEETWMPVDVTMLGYASFSSAKLIINIIRATLFVIV